VWIASKNSHFKTASTHFKAKREKGVGTPFPPHYTPACAPGNLLTLPWGGVPPG